jgi:shikimate dehydrogenase
MKRFALIGKKLDYSFSKDFFNHYFLEKKLNCVYENIEINSITEIATVLKSNKYTGFNVTIPYKEEIIPFLDELSLDAKLIGAVNTIYYKNKQIIGTNTDAFGFQQSIKPFLNNQHEKALILGTGGASKAVEFVLKNIGIDVLFISRNPKKSNQFSYLEINEQMLKSFKLIINCTPIGTFPNINEMPIFPVQFLNSEHFVIDLIYNPSKTKFLLESEKYGATTLNGLSMLQEQALKSWEIWNSN